MAIHKMAPMFKLSTEEVSLAKQFTIRRTLKHSLSIYKEHDEQIPAYAYLHGFFYFPVKDKYPEVEAIDSDAIISHEVGHHLHKIVNPHISEGVRTFVRTGKLPRGHSELCEIVAEYANLFSGIRGCDDSLYESVYRDPIRVYLKYGPEFLPVLARISLDEAVRRRLIKWA